eukprot:scaffold42641_cov58-Attheya_sp.AAC.1
MVDLDMYWYKKIHEVVLITGVHSWSLSPRNFIHKRHAAPSDNEDNDDRTNMCAMVYLLQLFVL